MPRKKPFSAKQKKKQLQERRQRKQGSGPSYAASDSDSEGSTEDATETDEYRGAEQKTGSGDKAEARQRAEGGASGKKTEVLKNVQKVHQQPGLMSHGKYDPNKYRLHFFQESKEEIQKRKEKARQPYKLLPEACLEVDAEELIETCIEIPKRPPWDYSLSKEKLESNEERYFKNYLDNLFTEYKLDELSYMELNLETWRQLWRVLEMSEIFLIIVDIRHPAMHFPPALYKHITEDLKKSVIILFNKVDLAPPSLVVAWQHFFKQHFPLVDVVCFSAFPKSKEEVEQIRQNIGKAVFKRRKRGTFRALGPKELYQVCEKIVESEVDLSSWAEKIEADQGVEEEDSDESESDEETIEEVSAAKLDLAYKEHKKYKDGVLTIGCVGYPNVGKSSVINGLMGKKVVSVSRTPGHTKHFQTIFLTPTVRLCDSPGLVFPSKVDRNLQILGGIYPIAQVREPYSTIQFLAERLDLPRLLKLKPVDEDANIKTYQWSALDICESWAQKRGFLTAKAARLDAYRAANNLLRLALDGRLCLCLYPQGYVQKKENWETHEDTQSFVELQNKYRQKTKAPDDADEKEELFPSSNEEEQVDIEELDKGTQPKPEAFRNKFALLGDDD